MPRSFVAPLTILAVGLAALAYLHAQPAPTAGPVAYTGATIHTAAGEPVAKGVLVVDKGKIGAVGDADTPVPAGAKVIDLTGKTVIPGLVDTHSHIGIFGRPGVQANADGNEGSGPVQSGLRAVDAVNPDDASIRMAVAGGITTANIMPGSGNVIGGQTLYVKLRGRTVEEMIVQAMGVLGGLKMANGENPKSFNFGRNKAAPGTRMKLAAMQRAEFVKAREYKAKLDAAKKDGKEIERDVALEPLVEVLERKRTVHFHCHRADDLVSALRLAKEFNFEIVLQHATEGYRVIPELIAGKVSVSLTLIDSPGGKMEVAGLLEENAATLAKAGVRVAINTDDPVTESRFYLRTGSIAVRGGMTTAQALAALTINPAAMMHLDHRVGSLEKGKDADFVVLSGEPFSVYTQVLQTVIDGKIVYDREKTADWTYHSGGYALTDRDRLPAKPALATPLGKAITPPREKGAAKPKDGTFAVRAGRIHTVTGTPILDGTIVVREGKIVAVGPRATTPIPAGVPILSATVVTPGLIDADSCVGLSGGTNTTGDQDQDEKSDPNQADIRALDGFNPDEALLAFVRREGVTALHAVPGRTNVFAGQTAVFKTAGRTAEKMALKPTAGLLVNLGEAVKGAYAGKPPTTRMGTAALVRAAFAKAQSYAKKAAGKEKPPGDAKMDALSLALAKKIPVIFAAHRADDLRTALRIAEEFGLDARFHLATEGYLVSDLLAKSGVGVVVHPPMQRVAGSLETMHTSLVNAAALAKAKVPLAIGTNFEGYVPKTRVLRSEAAIAAVNGLGHAKALEAITLAPAKMLGIDKDRGSIEVGKAADLVLYDGDCFEHATHVLWTLIDGRIVYDRDEEMSVPFARRAMPLAGSGVECCLGVW